MIRIGVECEQLEQNRFGIGQTLAQLLAALTEVPDIEKQFKFILYFKAHAPDDLFLNHPLFEKKTLLPGRGFFNVSFNVFYHILLPLRCVLDRIDVFLFPSNMLPAFFMGKKAVVVLVNDVYWEAHRGHIPFKHRLSYLLFCWWAARRARIMTISECSRRDLQRWYGIPDTRIFVNPWGIAETFNALPLTKEYQEKMAQLKKKAGIRNHFILSIGQAFPRRHVTEAIAAFGGIARAHPDVQYLVACADKYNPPALAIAAAEANAAAGREAVVLIDYIPREDVPYLIRAARALVYVSSKEAYGIPPIEAVRSGTPAIVADTPTTREFFGEEGFFVRFPENPHDIAARMHEVLEDETRARRITAAHTRRAQSLTWPAHVKKLLAVLSELSGT